MPERRADRWIALLAGVVLNVVIGGVYAWSDLATRLSAEYGFTGSQTGLVFGTMIAVFTLVMIPGGYLLKRYGPRRTAGLGAVLFAAGYLVASFAGDRYPVLILALGGLTGSGIGLIYLCPIVIGTRLFPKHRGMVTGLSVMGFGAGGILWSAVLHGLLEPTVHPIASVLRLIAIGSGGLACAAAWLLTAGHGSSDRVDGSGRTPIQNLNRVDDPRWLFLGLFGGTFAGLLVVSHLRSMAVAAGLDGALHSLAIPAFALGNVVGRLLWGGIHDWLGSRRSILLSLSSQVGALLLLAALLFWSVGSWVLLLGIFLIGTGFGSCFVVYASAMMERYGVDRFSSLYPKIFLGYGASALVAPLIGGWLVDRTGGYDLPVALALLVILGTLLLVSVRARHRPLPVLPLIPPD